MGTHIIFELAAQLGGGAAGAGSAGHVIPAWPVVLATLTSEEGQWLATAVVVVAAVLVILVALKNLAQPERVKAPEFKTFVEYVHTKNHDFEGQINHLNLSTEERRTEAAEQQAELMKQLAELGEKMDGKRSASVGNLHEQLKASELKLAAVERDAQTHTQQLAAIDAKLTNILRALPRNRGGDHS